MTQPTGLRRVAEHLLSIDVRALALFRAAIAVLLIGESAFLLAGAQRPVTGVYEFVVVWNPAIILPAAIALLLGMWTPAATGLCWIVYVLRVRHDLMHGSADMQNYVLVVLLFWAVFLPLGAVYSIDRRRTSNPVDTPRGFLSVASAGVLIQIALIYYSAGLGKNGDEWLWQATALQTILSGETFPTTFGRYLLDWPTLLTLLSRATVVLETAGPLLLFVPGRANPTIRLVIVVLFMSFHVGLLLTMRLGFFPVVCIAAWLLYVPPSVWDRLPLFRNARVSSLRPHRDPVRWRDGVAAVALAYILGSCLLNWVAPDSKGARVYQRPGKEVCLYQLWFMFNTPSKGRRK